MDYKMKFIGGILSCLLAVSISTINAQTPCNDTLGNWHLEMDRTYFQKVYSYPEKDSATLQQEVLAMIRTVENVSDVQEVTGTITATISNRWVRFQKFGYQRSKMPIAILSPQNFTISCDIKPGKYRVTVSNIVNVPDVTPNLGPSYWNSIPYKSKTGCLTTASTVIFALRAMDDDYSDLFILPVLTQDW